LFEGLEDFLALAEVPEEQLKSAGHQRRIVVHDKVEKHAEERAASMSIKIKLSRLSTKAERKRFQKMGEMSWSVSRGN
jgi:hypothetical protein